MIYPQIKAHTVSESGYDARNNKQQRPEPYLNGIYDIQGKCFPEHSESLEGQPVIYFFISETCHQEHDQTTGQRTGNEHAVKVAGVVDLESVIISVNKLHIS